MTGKMDVLAGEYEVLYGNGSDAKDLKTTKTIVQKSNYIMD
jgi:hypothetical protein